MLHQSARKLIKEKNQTNVSKEIRYELMMMISPVNHKIDGSVTKDQSRNVYRILERVSSTLALDLNVQIYFQLTKPTLFHRSQLQLINHLTSLVSTKLSIDNLHGKLIEVLVAGKTINQLKQEIVKALDAKVWFINILRLFKKQPIVIYL